MDRETLVFALVAVVCYFLAFLTSHIFVAHVLSPQLRSELGNKARYVAIDGIRGYLAFGVYVHHCIVNWAYLRNGHSGPPPHNFENQLGKTSVAIFFMITAFLFWGRVEAKKSLDWKSFFVSRLFRIYPLYLVYFLVLCVGVAVWSHGTALEPASAITVEVFRWLFFRTPIINHYNGTPLPGVTWTLLYEAWFYLSLPLLASVFLRRNAMWWKLAALLVVAGLFAVNHLEIGIACAFLGGVLAVYWRADARRIQFADTRRAAFFALLCLAGVVLFLFDPFNAAGIPLLTVFFLVIASGNTLFGLLNRPGALWLGEISYSIYLGHALILWIIMQHVFPRLPYFHPTTLWLAISSIAITPVVILLTSASYIFIERPFIDIGHRIVKRVLAQPAA